MVFTILPREAICGFLNNYIIVMVMLANVEQNFLKLHL